MTAEDDCVYDEAGIRHPLSDYHEHIDGMFSDANGVLYHAGCGTGVEPWHVVMRRDTTGRLPAPKWYHPESTENIDGANTCTASRIMPFDPEKSSEVAWLIRTLQIHNERLSNRLAQMDEILGSLWNTFDEHMNREHGIFFMPCECGKGNVIRLDSYDRDDPPGCDHCGREIPWPKCSCCDAEFEPRYLED